MITRKKTRQVKVGGVNIGGRAPISIQSMANAESRDVKAVVSQIKALEKAGCEIVRIAVKNSDDAEAVREIKKRINIPLVCDIHFNYQLALKAIRMGADKIRLNPGNINKPEEVAAVARAAKNAGIPIRVGLNSGSVKISSRERDMASALVNSAISYTKMLEASGFHDIIISLKASDVITTIGAYRRMSEHSDYPLHLGVTAAGPYDAGIVKSSIGIGSLLADGIGDTVRVSLTSDPVNEVKAARLMLGALGLRRFGPEIISCPTCGRCQVDLIGIVSDLERNLSTMNYKLSTSATKIGGSACGGKRPLTIAVMGCEVNGPGEAMCADIGVAFGKNSGMLFKNGKIFKKVAAKNAVKELLSLL